MRSIAEIKQSMCDVFMQNETLAQAYGFTIGDSWNSVFNKVSIENLLLYIVAVGIYTIEALLNEHKKEVDEQIEAMSVHRPKWYRDKVLAFMKDMVLIEDTDQYDTTGMSDGDIEQARVVKYAAATENNDASLLTIKVAGYSNGQQSPLDEDTETQLRSYLQEIKDAGVRIALVNQEADLFNCTIDVYYNALLTASMVENAVRKAISGYVENLSFNSVYTNMELVDAVQNVSGVKIAELKHSSVMVAGESTETAIDARHTPTAGYMKANVLTINMKVYNE